MTPISQINQGATAAEVAYTLASLPATGDLDLCLGADSNGFAIRVRSSGAIECHNTSGSGGSSLGKQLGTAAAGDVYTIRVKNGQATLTAARANGTPVGSETFPASPALVTLPVRIVSRSTATGYRISRMTLKAV